jgi:hypothetical protein
MIVMKPASELQRGDMFSTDGGVVQDIRVSNGQVFIKTLLDGGVTKSGQRPADFPCPIYTPDEEGA